MSWDEWTGLMAEKRGRVPQGEFTKLSPTRYRRLSHRDRFQAHPLPGERAEALVAVAGLIALAVGIVIAGGAPTC